MAEQAGGAGAAHSPSILVGGPAVAPQSDDEARNQRIAGLEAKIGKLEASLVGAKQSLVAERALAKKGKN